MAHTAPEGGRDWTALVVPAILTALIPALFAFAVYVNSNLNDLQQYKERTGQQIVAMQRQLDDSIRRQERHSEAIDVKLDTVTGLVQQTQTSLNDLRKDLKR